MSKLELTNRELIETDIYSSMNVEEMRSQKNTIYEEIDKLRCAIDINKSEGLDTNELQTDVESLDDRIEYLDRLIDVKTGKMADETERNMAIAEIGGAIKNLLKDLRGLINQIDTQI